MGYNFNTPWKIPELENQNLPSFVQTCLGNCSVDLKLGNSGGLEDNWVGKFSFGGEKLSVMESSGSSKRVRTPTSANLVPSCLVDGCTSDLSKCRDYHRRHKVCELHSKTSKVLIRGLEQRFCQQCSRFHSLSEFDEGKRSCRKRLDGHNRRRRKPQPDSLSVNSARLFSYHQGTRYLQFGGSQLYSSTDSSPAWIGAVKTENDPLLCADQSSLNISIGRKGFPVSEYRCEKQFPFLQCSSSSTSPVFDAGSRLCSSSSKVFCDGATGSNRALSLLSSPLTDTREISLVHMVQHDHTPPVVPSLNFNSLGMEPEPVENVPVSEGNSNANIHDHNLFQTGSHQTLSFSWE